MAVSKHGEGKDASEECKSLRLAEIQCLAQARVVNESGQRDLILRIPALQRTFLARFF
jgi:hypothetical protein